MTKKVLASSPSRRTERFISFIGSAKFFWIVVAVFVFQSLWIALTARYPMAFDEQLHFGIISIYSHHLSPFLSGQPSGANQFGALTADPSYLYQYLMSFPLRLIQLFTANLTIQVILLRIINIALFGSSLFIFRKLFRLAKTSDALSHILLFCFVLLPVVPLLAGQVNYDNLMVPATALAVYLTACFSQRLRATKAWNWGAFGGLLSVCLLACLVKYAFMPVFMAIVIWLVIDWRWLRKQHRTSATQVEKPKASSWRIIGYGALLLISAVLFFQRYGLNVIRYHTPIPECDQVLSIDQCQAYGPWARNYSFGQQNIHLPISQVLTYPFIWIYHSLNELIFSITSHFNASGTIDYYGAPQLIVIEVLAWTIFGLGLLAVLYYWRRLCQDRLLRLFGLIIALYVAALGGQNYLDYLHLGYPVAIHGRYLLPILPLILLLVARAFGFALRDLPWRRSNLPTRKLIASGFVLVVLLVEGGGFGTYVIRSHDDWAWPQSRAAQRANQTARNVLKPVVINIGS